MNGAVAKKLKGLPQRPGVYIFKDAKGMVLYVGKAIKLRPRVSSYFKPGAEPDRPHIQIMIPLIADLDYVITDNELESLILESTYIKQLRPKYNVILRDDKNYLFLKINLHDEIPTIQYERKPADTTARYFGPYTSGYEIKNTLRLMRKIFPYCANVKVSDKPCFFYHIGKCPGVCFGKISLADYREHYIKKIIQFLAGRQSQVLKDLQSQMKAAAHHGRFEQAAKRRDQIFALNRVMERQKLVYAEKLDQDVFSIYHDGAASINLFVIREGKLIRKENFILDNAKSASTSEILEQFLPQYYLDATDWPKEVLLPVKIGKEKLWLPLRGAAATKQSNPGSDRHVGRRPPRDGKIKFLVPTRGQKADLIKLGELNAKQYLESTSDKHLLEEARLMSSLKELQRVLDLPVLPARIEAFDISNIQGTNPVGSMVVFDFARPKKDQYRKFKINKKQTPDDFAMMREMLERRFKRSVAIARSPDGVVDDEATLAKIATRPAAARDGKSAWPLPDLILIDGGKGQLSSAVSVLKEYNLEIPILGLAKRLEEIFRPGQPKPLILPPNSIALFLLQRIRDEAHRFAITYHRKLRSRGLLASTLDQITGIGPAKKKILLETYGSAAGVRQASLTELGQIVGAKLAAKIKASL